MMLARGMMTSRSAIAARRAALISLVPSPSPLDHRGCRRLLRTRPHQRHRRPSPPPSATIPPPTTAPATPATPASMASARTIEEVLASIEEQRLEDEDRRGVERPKPWFNLLRHPSGAAWRSTDRVLGGATGEAVDADGDPDDDRDDDRDDRDDADADVEAEEDADANAGGGKRRRAGRRASVLSRTQFNLLRRSERTNKQLRRTLGSILEVQRALSIKRERERRLAANSAPAPPSSDDDGRRRRPKRQSIEDGRGRLVGDWREKRGEGKAAPTPPPPLLLCEDPSVALSLSIGMKSTASSTAEKRTRRMRRDAANRSNNAGPGDGDDYDDDDDAGSGGGPGGGGIGATDYYYADNEAARRASEAANATTNNPKSASRAAASARLAKSGYAGGADASSSAARKPVAYGPEQAMTSLKYRFGPNYSVVRRVLSEVRSLMGGGCGGGTFRPRRVLDFGSGVGSSGAAALDVFGVGRRGGRGAGGGGGGEDDVDDDDLGIDWVHSIDASRCMRETTEKVLKSVLEGSPWEDEANDGRNGASYLEEEEMLMLAEYERSLFGDGGGKSSDRERRTLERRRRRMERWEQTWERRTDARTRLTFGESIVDTASAASSSSSADGGRDDGDGVDDDSDRRRLPWQDQIDEQRRRTAEAKRRVQQQQQHQDRHQQRNKGSFDLILCSYTLSELPSVPASLAAAALLWEKLAPDGVLVFVEPGTPDGFGTLRSVRSMLLECCPPPEVGERRRRDRAAATAVAMAQPTTAKEADDDGYHVESDGQSSDDDTWPEECHVIAPCTHNGTCPMSRHQRDHVKRNSRFAKYESAEPKGEDDEGGAGEGGWMEGGGDDDDEEGSFQDMVDQWDDMTEGEKDEIKTMLGGGESMTDDDAKGMLEYMDSMGSDDEEEEDEDDDDSGQDSSSVDDDDDVVGDDQDYYNIEEGANRTGPSSKKSSIMAKTDVFGSSFCSFVHNFPGGTTRKRGEKFTYLVVQKRVPHSVEDGHGQDAFDAAAAPSKDPESLYEIDIVEMLSKSVHHAQKLKKEQLQKRLRQRRHGADGGNDGREEETPDHSYHEVQSRDLLRMAVEVEDQFLDSTIDSLGLEMLHGDERRRGWGRLIRAPLKRRGHVLLDYCSAGCGGTGGCPKKGSTDDGDDSKTTDGNDLPDGTQGRITRQKVSRGWSARAAPGCYSAARKARWGGLWPDLSERVKRIEMEEERERLRNGQEILPGTMIHCGPKSRKMVSH